MLLTRAYYAAKPLLPWRLRMAVRRFIAERKRDRYRGLWPIDSRAGTPPPGWHGWPDGKQFAFVLTHDVEGPVGLSRVRQLAEMEMSLGFRSCFNFIPEGTYTVPPALLAWLTDNGFEVGVHDLNHDGKLFRTREEFSRKAIRINEYLKTWGAVGFRSGFMLRNLDWQHDLNVLYCSTTFDTDPFEPQPDGVGTIFPFFVPASTSDGRLSSALCALSSDGQPTSDLRPLTSGAPRRGYVELPYTLPQDSTVFTLFRQKDATIWRRKLTWIARQGGMALLNVHPDYTLFDRDAIETQSEFPGAVYRHFLEHITATYAKDFWHALPREVAQFAREHRGLSHGVPAAQSIDCTAVKTPTPLKIWIDLDNTPHIPFFKPIIRELKNRGYDVFLTARDAYQVLDLADKFEMPYLKFGHHHGKHMTAKAYGVVARAMELLPTILRERPALAVNHGSRSQTLLSNLLGIPTVLIMDYEHSGRTRWLKSPRVLHARWSIFPECIQPNPGHPKAERKLFYRGIKEDVYAPEFKPDPALPALLGLNGNELVVTVRPPADEAHYHNPESDRLFVELMDYLLENPEARIILLPRNKHQGLAMKEHFPNWFASGRTVIPPCAIDGLSLLWISDLVVSGGGTMNREAAALGIPVFSIFRGKTGAVDRELEKQGRLVLIASVDDVRRKIPIRRRPKAATPDPTPRPAMQDILNHIERIIAAEGFAAVSA